jgi:pyruvate dehydrogenase E2 component (dihydrolipoamide acetyltransferase)
MSEVRHFLLPDLGEGLTEAEIVAWHVSVGDAVALNQVLVEVETEKAVVELPSPFAGTVVELLAEPGQTIDVGAPLIAVDTGSSGGAAETAPETTDTPSESPADAAEERVSVLVGYGPSAPPPSRRRKGRGHRGHDHDPERDHAAPPSSPASPTRPLAAPPVRFMARQQGIDLSEVTGHGPGGIITRDDLAAHVAGDGTEADERLAAPPGGDRHPPDSGRETRTPVRGVQKHMAEAMVRSVATAPQACVFLTVDVTPTSELVERLRANPHFEGARVTHLTLAARAAVLALGQHPALNSAWDEATHEVVVKHYVNLGIAVAGALGLVVPNIKDAQGMSLRELARALTELTDRARAARCAPEELRGGTFTLTNVGVFGVDAGVPILNPGEAGILALGAVQRRPWEHDGQIALRDVAVLSLAFDHRLVDGQGASRFLAAVGAVLADPTNLLALS